MFFIVILISFSLWGCDYHDRKAQTGNSQDKKPPPVLPSEPKPTEPVPLNYATVKRRVFGPYCLDCHSRLKNSGDFDLSDYDLLMTGHYIEPGKPEESMLYEMVVYGEMPPNSTLPEKWRQLLWDWINIGAPLN
jgi:hypothetical protein